MVEQPLGLLAFRPIDGQLGIAVVAHNPHAAHLQEAAEARLQGLALAQRKLQLSHPLAQAAELGLVFCRRLLGAIRHDFRLGGEGEIRTHDTGFRPYNGLANRRLRPLGHLSVGAWYYLRSGQISSAKVGRGFP